LERKAAQARAEDTYERIQRLEATGAATTQALVDAKAAAEQSRAAVVASQATLQKLLNGARSEEIVIAHAQAVQAQAAVAVAELNLADTELRAKSKGIVVTRAVEPGAMVQVGSPAIVVAFEDPVWVRGFAPEKALARLAPGSVVNVYSDARPEQPYRGQIGYVSPQAEFTPKNVETEELRTSLVYRFRVVVSDHDGGLRQGMPVTIRAGIAGK
jgi:HlyD family secretion protein